MKINFNIWKRIFLDHKFCIICTILGGIAGLAGLISGFAAGFFADMIFMRLSDEKQYKNAIIAAENKKKVDEPFPGCLYVCALGVYSLKSAESAAVLARKSFGNTYKADWNVLCSSAGDYKKVNGDLITECLASTLLSLFSSKKDSKGILDPIFNYLHISEFDWDEKNRGDRPSEYLSRLLNYTCENDELNNAYKILGLDKTADMKAVKKAHRNLSARYHPDKNQQSPDTSQYFTKIQTAYEKILKSQTLAK